MPIYMEIQYIVYDFEFSALKVLSLLQFLVIENQQKLKGSISRLEPFPDIPEFRELRSVQHKLKYNAGTFTLRQVTATDARADTLSFLCKFI